MQQFTSQHEGLINKFKSNCVCLLEKSLYGLKQSLGQWYEKFDNFVLTIALTRSAYKYCLILKEVLLNT